MKTNNKSATNPQPEEPMRSRSKSTKASPPASTADRLNELFIENDIHLNATQSEEGVSLCGDAEDIERLFRNHFDGCPGCAASVINDDWKLSIAAGVGGCGHLSLTWSARIPEDELDWFLMTVENFDDTDDPEDYLTLDDEEIEARFPIGTKVVYGPSSLEGKVVGRDGQTLAVHTNGLQKVDMVPAWLVRRGADAAHSVAPRQSPLSRRLPIGCLVKANHVCAMPARGKTALVVGYTSNGYVMVEGEAPDGRKVCVEQLPGGLQKIVSASPLTSSA